MAKETQPSTIIPAPQTTAAASAASRPTQLPSSAQQQSQNVAKTAAPTMQPPVGGISARGVAAANATAWGSQTVGGLWSITEDKNAWVFVNNVGWIRLSNASESGIMSLMALSASAKETGTTFSYRQESDGMLHEIYVW